MTISGIRYCPDCGVRELEKYQKKCSECRIATKQHCDAIANHRFRQSQKYRDYNAKNKQHRNEYMREYMRRKRSEKIRINNN